jgi:hypothetical protein
MLQIRNSWILVVTFDPNQISMNFLQAFEQEDPGILLTLHQDDSTSELEYA